MSEPTKVKLGDIDPVLLERIKQAIEKLNKSTPEEKS